MRAIINVATSFKLGQDPSTDDCDGCHKSVFCLSPQCSNFNRISWSWPSPFYSPVLWLRHFVSLCVCVCASVGWLRSRRVVKGPLAKKAAKQEKGFFCFCMPCFVLWPARQLLICFCLPFAAFPAKWKWKLVFSRLLTVLTRSTNTPATTPFSASNNKQRGIHLKCK